MLSGWLEIVGEQIWRQAYSQDRIVRPFNHESTPSCPLPGSFVGNPFVQLPTQIPGPDAPRPRSGKKKFPGVQMVNLGKGFRGDQVLSCRSTAGLSPWLWPTWRGQLAREFAISTGVVHQTTTSLSRLAPKLPFFYSSGLSSSRAALAAFLGFVLQFSFFQERNSI
jgi:hypothetical protein